MLPGSASWDRPDWTPNCKLNRYRRNSWLEICRQQTTFWKKDTLSKVTNKFLGIKRQFKINPSLGTTTRSSIRFYTIVKHKKQNPQENNVSKPQSYLRRLGFSLRSNSLEQSLKLSLSHPWIFQYRNSKWGHSRTKVLPKTILLKTFKPPGSIVKNFINRSLYRLIRPISPHYRSF